MLLHKAGISFLLLMMIQMSGSLDFDISGCDTVVELEGYTYCYVVTDILQTKNYSEALHVCHTMYNATLPTLTHQVLNDAVSGLVKIYGLNQVWIALREYINIWSWVKDSSVVGEQGCYKDEAAEPDLDYSYTSSNMTRRSCLYKCAKLKYKYAGLQKGDTCHCGNTFGKYEISVGCFTYCVGDYNSTCGGMLENYIMAVNGSYSQWSLAQPNNHLQYQTCAILDYENKYYWNDVECSEKHGMVCYLDYNMTACQYHNFTILDKWCVHMVTEKQSFFTSRSQCDDLGGLFGDVSSWERWLSFRNHIRKHGFLELSFWVGITKSHWTWSSGQRLAYSSWDQRNKRPSSVVQNCATITSPDGLWDDEFCSKRLRFICQIDDVPDMKTTPKPIIFTSQLSPWTTLTVPVTDEPKAKGPILSLKGPVPYFIFAGAAIFLIIIIVACAYNIRSCFRNRNHLEARKAAKVFSSIAGDSSKADDDQTIHQTEDIDIIFISAENLNTLTRSKDSVDKPQHIISCDNRVVAEKCNKQVQDQQSEQADSSDSGYANGNSHIDNTEN